MLFSFNTAIGLGIIANRHSQNHSPLLTPTLDGLTHKCPLTIGVNPVYGTPYTRYRAPRQDKAVRNDLRSVTFCKGMGDDQMLLDQSGTTPDFPHQPMM